MEKVHYRVQFIDFLIINLPAILFLGLVPLGLGARLYLPGVWRWSSVPLFVWGISGASLLFRDYSVRKKALYLRLLLLNENRDLPRHTLYLRSTLCGLAIQWALRVRFKKINRRFTV